MSRTLYVLRHAKSSWADASLPDHDRPLAPRGERACTLVAEHLRRQGISADLVLCSSSRRTRETLERVAPALGEGHETRIEPELYGATARQLLARLGELPGSVSSVLVIGHNPAMQDLVLELAGPNDVRDAVARKYPTGALATLVIDGDWPSLAAGSAELTAFVRPSDLDRARS